MRDHDDGGGGATPSRRSVLKGLAGLATAAAATTASPAHALSWSTFFQKHYKEMTPEDKEQVLARLRADVKAGYGVDVDIHDPPPAANASFVYCLNLSLCNGNRKCVTACVEENNQSRDPAIRRPDLHDDGEGGLGDPPRRVGGRAGGRSVRGDGFGDGRRRVRSTTVEG